MSCFSWPIPYIQLGHNGEKYGTRENEHEMEEIIFTTEDGEVISHFTNTTMLGSS